MTLKEIAREAGVSAMTVSNVVNHNDAKVSEETRKRVQAVIDKYGYVPNMSARSLSAQNSRIIALMLPIQIEEEKLQEIAQVDPAAAESIKNTLADYYSSAMVGYLESKLKPMGYYTMLRSFYRAEEVLELQRNWKVDGCILLMPKISDAENRMILTQSQCPVVLIDRFYPDLPMLSVGSDDYHGGYLAARSASGLATGKSRLFPPAPPKRSTARPSSKTGMRVTWRPSVKPRFRQRKSYCWGFTAAFPAAELRAVYPFAGKRKATDGAGHGVGRIGHRGGRGPERGRAPGPGGHLGHRVR